MFLHVIEIYLVLLLNIICGMITSHCIYPFYYFWIFKEMKSNFLVTPNILLLTFLYIPIVHVFY